MPTLVAPIELIADKTTPRAWQPYALTVVLAAFSVIAVAIIFALPMAEPALMAVAGP